MRCKELDSLERGNPSLKNEKKNFKKIRKQNDTERGLDDY
jgi:hypothetical protein